jgi:hypothetical protein
MRLAIAFWEKGASWRAQGWAGEKGPHRQSHVTSQVAPGSDMGAIPKKAASKLGRTIIERCSLGKRARLGATRVGWVRMSAHAVTKPGYSRQAADYTSELGGIILCWPEYFRDKSI